MKRTLFALIASTALIACGGGGGGDPDAGDDGDDTTPDADLTPDAEEVIPYPLSNVLSLANGLSISDTAPEIQTSAVLPDNDYLVWVGAYELNGMGAPPGVKDYEITLCPSTYTPPTVLPACAHTEVNDTANETTPEATGDTVGATPFDICGVLNAKTPTAQQQVDRDNFSFTVAADARVEFRLSSANPQAMTVMVVEVTGCGGAGGFCGDALFLASHGVTSINLAAGTYTASAVSLAQAMPAGNSDYRITVSTSDLDTRCTTLVGPATYTERSDGATNNGNDLVEVRYATQPPIQLTPAATDNPERSNVTLGASSVKLGGTLAMTADQADEYHDKDTFLIRTGATTNQLDVIISWAGMDTDLDYFVFIPVP